MQEHAGMEDHPAPSRGARLSVNTGGTGSEPPRHSGWQRASRHNASTPPRAAPKRATATRA